MHFTRILLLRRSVLVYGLHLMQDLSLELFLVGLGVEARLGCALTNRAPLDSLLSVDLIHIQAVLLCLLFAAQAVASIAPFW